MTKNQRLLRIVLIVMLALTCLTLGAQTLARRSGVFEQLDLLVDVRHEIVDQYVEEPNQQKMTEAAVRAMVESLDDPYTNYVAPEDLEPFDKQIRGTFSGIGAEVDIDDAGHLVIATPLDDSPAWKAGVLAGDTVLEVDGASITELFANLDTPAAKLRAAVKRLQGPEGSKVSIKVRHASGKEAVIPITRGQINVQTVRGVRRGADLHWDYMLDKANKIGYVRISQFTETTAENTKAAFEQLAKQEAKGLILDLRFNPGGLLDSAKEISDLFLPAGKRIVSVKGRAVPERVMMSTDSGTIPDIPVVVLANEYSASAAEVVTGALADNHRAKFIGTRTWGKGSVQQVRMLESGQGALKITNAYYYLPSGRNIHRRKDKPTWGVDPDDGFYVAMTAEQNDAMLKIRRAGDVLKDNGNGDTAKPMTPERIEKELADPQLAAGLRALLGKLAGGEWPKVGQSGAAHLAQEARRDALQRQRQSLMTRVESIDKELTRLETADTQPATLPGAMPAIPEATQPDEE